MTRFARRARVFFVEEPVPTDAPVPSLDVHQAEGGIRLLVPRLPHGLDRDRADRAQEELLRRYLAAEGVERPVLWYYTPMALGFTADWPAAAVVYDCMDELAAFKDPPPELPERERRLLARADVVFTGGVSLYEAKRSLHPNVHAMPSGVDVAHFATARSINGEPEDQAALPRPRLGYFGVIDERFDSALLAAVAVQRPAWQFVLIGPVVKIDPVSLPRGPNLHYLGMRPYGDLPRYLAGWDVALLPFARNDSTRFISPTKTPEYLAAGRPVVSTPITDVVRTFGEAGLVHLGATPSAFAAAVDAALEQGRAPEAWLPRVDRVLAGMSWDRTWARMKDLIECAL